MANVDLVMRLLAEDRASGTFKKVAGETDRAAKRLDKFKRVAGTVSAAAIVAFGVSSVKAYADAERQQAKLEGAYKRFPAVADVPIGALRDLNSELQKTTVYDDDVVAGAQAVLAQFKLTGSQIKSLTPLLLDYASATGKDVTTAATDVGKAMMGQGRALKAVGIDFKTTGDAAADFTNLTDALRKQVGGFAENEGKTAAGQMAILSNQFGDLQETVGQALLPTLQTLTNTVTPLLNKFNSLPEGVKSTTIAIGALGAGFILLAPKILAAKELLAGFSAQAGGGAGAAAGVGKFRGALGRAAGFLGAAGPWGLAIGAGITALTLFGNTSEDAARAQQSFRAALDASNGALDEQVRKSVAVEAENRGLLKTARDLGIAEDIVVDAILGDVDARKQLIDATTRIVKQGPQVANGGRVLSGVYQEQSAAASRLREGLGLLEGEFGDQVKANKRVNAAMDTTAKKMREVASVARNGVVLKIKPQITGRGEIIIGGAGGRQILDVDYRAGGGPVTAGRPYIVGEKRPELFVPNQSGTIIPRVPAMAGGGTAQVNVYLDGRMVQTSLVDLKNAQGGRLNF